MPLDPEFLRETKAMGFSDRRIAEFEERHRSLESRSGGANSA